MVNESKLCRSKNSFLSFRLQSAPSFSFPAWVSRVSTHERWDVFSENAATAESQIQILLRRAHILRAAIALSVLSVLLASVLIIVLFISAINQLAFAGIVAGLSPLGLPLVRQQ